MSSKRLENCPSDQLVSNENMVRDHALRQYVMLHKQQSRLKALQNQLSILEEELRERAMIEQDAVESFAKKECLRFCGDFTTQLPQELRDMIYGYLLPQIEKPIDREYFRSTMDPVTKLHTYDTKRSRISHHPDHFWDVEYVGEKFAQELAKKYYRTMTFKFGDDEGLIQRFLETEFFSLDCKPSDLVTKVEIHLCAITFDRSSCIGYFFGCPTTPEKLRAALGGLSSLRSGAKIVVHFSTQGKDEFAKEAQKSTAISALGPHLRDLKVNGYNVELVIDRDGHVDLEALSMD